MSSGKTLSNGTLSLRFMQNAQRAKQEKTVELEQAKDKDEAEWEVSEGIRDAWGLASRSGSRHKSQHTVTYEASYLPFLFPSLRQAGNYSDNEDEPVASTSTIRMNGRRTFKKGEEVLNHADSTVDEVEVKKEVESHSTSLPEETKKPENLVLIKKGMAQAVASKLSTKRASKLAERDRDRVPSTLPRISEAGVPVLSMISGEDSSSVGLDMRSLRRKAGDGIKKDPEEVSHFPTAAGVSYADSKPAIPKILGNDEKKPMGFLRPAGVDSPTAGNSRPVSKKLGKRARGGPTTISGAPPTITGNESEQPKKKKKQKKQETELSTISMQRS